MPLTPQPLSAPVSLLHAQVSSLEQTVAELRQALEESRRENTLLRQKLDALAQRCFGKKSE